MMRSLGSCVAVGLVGWTLCCGTPNAQAQQPSEDAADKIGAMIEGYQESHQAWVVAVSSETDPARQHALISERPDKEGVIRAVLELAADAGDGETAMMGMAWGYMESGDEAVRSAALARLLEGWAEHPAMRNVIPAMERDDDARARAALARLAELETNEGVCLAARIGLASWLDRVGGDRAAAEELLQSVADGGSALRHPEGGTMSEHAAARLFSMRYLSVGAEVPELEGLDLAGEPMRLTEYRGRVVLLTFWAHWCGGCMQQAEAERALVARFAGRPFSMLGVNNDPGPVKAVLARGSEGVVPWRSFRNDTPERPQSSIARAWAVRTLPTTLLIGADGVIQRVWWGEIATPDDLFESVERATAEAEAVSG